MANEIDATGTGGMGSLGQEQARDGARPRQGPTAKVGLALPDIKSVTNDIRELNEAIKKLNTTIQGQYHSNVIAGWGARLGNAVKSAAGMLSGGSGVPSSGAAPTPLQQMTQEQADKVSKVSTNNGGSPKGGGSSTASYTTGGSPPVTGTTTPSTADTTASNIAGKSIEGATKYAVEKSSGWEDIPLFGTGGRVTRMIYGGIAGGGIQYAYNRINGPTGNQNATLQAAQALAPHVTMMNAANVHPSDGLGRVLNNLPFTMRMMIAAMGNEYPVLGTQQDMLSTVAAGTSVGALLRGTNNRNGFYESVRQMQVLNPGMAPGNIANGLAGYIGNTQSQQKGLFYGQGAFSMVGQGGSYKTLSQWAAGITKFLEQQRGGGAQGKKFTRAELVTQNFPGSNINAWFQMMGVPQNMVDYWWTYVLSDTADVQDMDSKKLLEVVQKDRGVNLGYERLRNVAAGTQREFRFGSEMYKSYALKESADRRFNQSMGAVDQGLGKLIQNSKVGNILSLTPTPIMEFLLPFLSGIATSPMGGLASLLGNMMGLSGSDTRGDSLSWGDFNPLSPDFKDFPDSLPKQGIYGDPMPYGDVGPYGSTTTSHLSPDLARKVQEMMKANPRLRISSSYRDTHTQNRLRRNGGPVARPSRSAHTRGWAVDIGPTSEGAWLAANAGKFGLQTAVSKGEPWHVQLAGSMPYGDSSAADKLGDQKYSKQAWGFMNTEDDNALKSLVKMLEFIIKGDSGSFGSFVDSATYSWSKLMLAPLSGLLKLFGTSDLFDNGNKDFLGILNEESDTSVGKVARYSVPRGFEGFSSDRDLSYSDRFGFPGYNFGDPTDLLSRGAKVIAPVVFQNKITVNANGSMTSTAAKATASAIADHLEAEVSRRQWSVT